MCRLIAEKLLNEHLPERPTTEERESKNYWMDRGIAMEPIAIKAFEKAREVQFEPVGFITSPLGRFGCSPDGLVAGKNESIEIKSPAPWTQINYLLAEPDDPKGPWKDYRPQVQGQMLVGHFECVHFYTFHPRMPARYVCTLPQSAYMATLQQALDDFLGEFDMELRKARELGTYIRAEEILNVRD